MPIRGVIGTTVVWIRILIGTTVVRIASAIHYILTRIYSIRHYKAELNEAELLLPLRVQAHIVIGKKFIFSYNVLAIQIHIFFLGYYLPTLSKYIYSLKFYKVMTSSFSILVRTRK